MKKIVKLVSLVLVAVLLVSLTACAKTIPHTGDTDNKNMTVITDHAGNTVEVPKKIERIAICNIFPVPSVLSVFFNSAEKIVGMDKASMISAQNSLLSELYPEILKAEPGYIDGTNLNIEELMKLKPDVVIYNAANEAIGKTLRDAGLCAVALAVNKWEYDAIETLNQWIDLFSQMFPSNDRVDTVKKYSNAVYQKVQDRVKDLPENERQRIFFLFQYSESNMATSGAHFFGQWWADAIGAINVGEEIDTDNSVVVNMEQVYDWNPQQILITNFTTAQPEDLYENTLSGYDWSEIDAVKNEKVHKMPLGMYRSYTCGVDTPVTLLWMAKTVYPELFSDIDITAETQKYYKDVFGITLTVKQAESIFAPSSDASAF